MTIVQDRPGPGVSRARWRRGYWTRCALLVLLASIAGTVQAAVSARLDRDHIAEGETVQMVVEADGQVSERLDTSVLEKDFDVLGVSSGSRVNIINGRMDASTNWTVSLAPKRSGELTVPSLEVEGEHTRPLTLRVIKASAAKGSGSGGAILVETEVDRTDPYVQAMVRYTVRLLYRAKLARGELSDPSAENALVYKLGDDREYTTKRGGQTYRVLERRYAVFPQTSGELALPGPVLDARVQASTSRMRSRLQDLFDESFFGSIPFGEELTATRRVRVRGEPRTLSVRPRPEQSTGRQWLPAEKLELSEQWQPQGQETRVGEPITRIVNLSARATTGEQLPDLEPDAAEGFKVYPDRGEAQTHTIEQGIEGEKTQSIAYVPVRPGHFTLPSLTVRWWDTRADRERVAELPERSMDVLPAVAASGAGSTPVAQTVPPPEPSLGKPSAGSGPAAGTAPAPPQLGLGAGAASDGPGIWPWISALFAVLWLATLALWWRSGAGASGPVDVGRSADRGLLGQAGSGAARRRFVSACRSNDPELARRVLLEWAKAHWPDDPPRGLEDLARRLSDSRVQAALAELDRVLYRGGDPRWDGSNLAGVLNRLPPRTNDEAAQVPLPDLYA
jgi:hypothetical protein